MAVDRLASHATETCPPWMRSEYAKAYASESWVERLGVPVVVLVVGLEIAVVVVVDAPLPVVAASAAPSPNQSCEGIEPTVVVVVYLFLLIVTGLRQRHRAADRAEVHAGEKIAHDLRHDRIPGGVVERTGLAVARVGRALLVELVDVVGVGPDDAGRVEHERILIIAFEHLVIVRQGRHTATLISVV
jgi:hypothetical protein